MIGTLQRVADTRWSSYYNSLCNLLNMYNATCFVLKNVIDDGSTYTQRGEADLAYAKITSFEFVLNLLVMKEILGVTDELCQTLQLKS